MNSFYRINKSTLPVWSFLICLALLFSQGAKLHIHTIDHDQKQLLKDHHSHSGVEESSHKHLSKAHSILDRSHDYQYSTMISEVLISADGLLKNSLYNIFVSTVIALLFSLIISCCSGRFIQRYKETKLIFYEYYVLSPPLRAPPQF